MIFIGDIHGKFSHLEHLIKTSGEKALFQVGDFGLGFNIWGADKKILEHLSTLLVKEDKYLFVIRGNHDNPMYWNEPYTSMFERIGLMPDYSVLEVEEKNVLCIGGGISLDRSIRKVGVDYWEDEQVEERPEALEKCIEHRIDIVVTHTAPLFCQPRGYGQIVHEYATVDVALYDELPEERKILDRVHDKLAEKGTIAHWIYGHFHEDYEEDINGIKFIGLGIGQQVKI